MSQSFQDIAHSLRVSYRSGSDDLLTDFYNPCLERSVLYQRAVGYFTSFGLAHAARGIARLVESGGKMRLVASPALEEQDCEALRRGMERPEEVLRGVAARNLTEIEDLLIKERLSALAWLIANRCLEVRLAIRIGADGGPCRGIYHEKMGVFTDSEGHQVAFSGSSNETAGGLIDNFENIDVYWSWDERRVQRKIADFEALWENHTPGLRLFEFTEISNDLLSRLSIALETKYQRGDCRSPDRSNEADPRLPAGGAREVEGRRWARNSRNGDWHGKNADRTASRPANGREH